jgi:hypothetical protein
MSASLYKVAFIGDDGHARHTEQISASCDDEAVGLAQDRLDAMEVLAIADVWLESERVAIIARQSRVRPQQYAAA